MSHHYIRKINNNFKTNTSELFFHKAQSSLKGERRLKAMLSNGFRAFRQPHTQMSPKRNEWGEDEREKKASHQWAVLSPILVKRCKEKTPAPHFFHSNAALEAYNQLQAPVLL